MPIITAFIAVVLGLMIVVFASTITAILTSVFVGIFVTVYIYVTLSSKMAKNEIVANDEI